MQHSQAGRIETIRFTSHSIGSWPVFDEDVEVGEGSMISLLAHEPEATRTDGCSSFFVIVFHSNGMAHFSHTVGCGTPPLFCSIISRGRWL